MRFRLLVGRWQFWDSNGYKDVHMFHLWVNTAFVDNFYLCLDKRNLDEAIKDKASLLARALLPLAASACISGFSIAPTTISPVFPSFCFFSPSCLPVAAP